METAFHQQLGFARADEFDGLLGGGLAVRNVDDLNAAEVERERLGDAAVILSFGPTRMGLISPASAASSAPLSEVSSQGCATAVAEGGCFFAAAIRRSYFSCRRNVRLLRSRS